MNTVFLPPGTVFLPPGTFADPTLDAMKTVSKTLAGQSLSSVSAANADQLGEARAAETASIEQTSGWDAYDVWRRFIKEAREARKRDAERD